jgi:hypothetical protein
LLPTCVMLTLAMFSLFQSSAVPSWGLWLACALTFDVAGTLGITVAIMVAGRRHRAGR